MPHDRIRSRVSSLIIGCVAEKETRKATSARVSERAVMSSTRRDAVSFLGTVLSTYIILCGLQQLAPAYLSITPGPGSGIVEQGGVLHGVPGGPGGMPSESTAGNEVANNRVPCGSLPPLGTVTIHHPLRSWGRAVDPDPDVYVSYDSDREFAVPLDGMEFDSDSLVYIFYVGSGASSRRDTSVRFQLGSMEQRNSTLGGPHDFMGAVSPEKAIPLRTASLEVSRCHALIVEAEGRRFTRHFRVTARKSTVTPYCGPFCG